MKKLLSTKILPAVQKKLLESSGWEVIEYDAISIEWILFKAPKEIQNAIFTSQNAVRSILQKNIHIENCFCVGEKTKALLEENGQKVLKMTQNALKLAHFIQKNYENEDFYFFSGSRRREEIPFAIKNSKNTLFEVKTYKTELNLIKFDEKWDGILFFSPSGAESFFSENEIKNYEGSCTCFCIGKTTAEVAKKYSYNIILSDSTTMEGVVAKTIQSLIANA